MNRKRSVTLLAGLQAAVIVALFLSPVFAAPGDVTLKRKEGAGANFPAAVFPHWVHRINYRCDACHTRLFEMASGKAEISMADINAGRACGTCHNHQRAFGSDFNSCNRCHVPVAGN